MNFGSYDLENLPYLHVLETGIDPLRYCPNYFAVSKQLHSGGMHACGIWSMLCGLFCCFINSNELFNNFTGNAEGGLGYSEKYSLGFLSHRLRFKHRTDVCFVSAFCLKKGENCNNFLLATFCFCHMYRFRPAVACKSWFCINLTLMNKISKIFSSFSGIMYAF